MISENQGLDKLKFAHEQLLREGKSSFGLSLYEFLKALHKNPEALTYIQALAAAQKEEDTLPHAQAEEVLLQELRSMHGKIEAYRLGKKIKLPQSLMPFNRDIQDHCKRKKIKLSQDLESLRDMCEFSAYDQGKIISSADLPVSLNQAIIMELSFLLSLGTQHLKFVKQFAILNDEQIDKNAKNAIKRLKKKHPILVEKFKKTHLSLKKLKQGYPIIMEKLKIEEIFFSWLDRKNAFERKQGSMLWYALEKLNQFFDTYENHEDIRAEAYRTNNHLLDAYAYNHFREIEKIADDNQDYMDELRRYANGLFYALKESGPNPSSSETSFDESTGRLCIRGKIIDITLSTNLCHFLGLFFPCGKPSPKLFDQDYILEDLRPFGLDDSSTDNEEPKKKVLNLRREANEKAKKVGIKEFIVLHKKNAKEPGKLGIHQDYR